MTIAEITISLSAIGSKIWPIFDSTFHFRASAPSRKSVIPQKTNKIPAKSLKKLFSKKKNKIKMGEEKSRKNVSVFGMFCFILINTAIINTIFIFKKIMF